MYSIVYIIAENGLLVNKILKARDALKSILSDIFRILA